MRGFTSSYLLLLMVSPALADDPKPAKNASAPEAVVWKLDALNKEPLKLLKAVPDPAAGNVRFVVELTRPITFTEQLDWESDHGPVIFRFVDNDGVVVKSVKPRWEGEMIPKKGTRLRMILTMPSEKVLAQTHAIEPTEHH
jgi:hypothetical protein